MGAPKCQRPSGDDLMSNSTASIDTPTRWRTVNACRRCRQRKVKCSGSAPCLNCATRGQLCIFDAADRRVVISERHLRNLERGAKAINGQSSRLSNPISSLATGRDQEEQDDPPLPLTGNPELGVEDRGSSIRRLRENVPTEPDDGLSPLLNSPGKPGKRQACGRTVSTWAFSQEVRQILRSRSSGGRSHQSKDDAQVSYLISLQDRTQLESSAFSLPPKEHIKHLARVVDFHLNANHCVFNHKAFEEQLSRASTQSLHTAAGIWLVKLCLMVALGKVFLEKGATKFGPPGIRDFLQGVHALPSNIILCEDPLPAIETLCLLAIYAQAADLHTIAYLYTGQASRIAHSCRLDTEWHLYKPHEQTHVQRIWWTVCALDQRQSAIVGAVPDYLIQEQTNTILPKDDNPESAFSLSLRVNLCLASLLTRVVTVVSRPTTAGPTNPSIMNEFIPEIQELYRLGQVIRNAQPLCYERSLWTISRPVATLHLLYCHCVILTTRPILVHIVRLCFNHDDPFASTDASSEPAFEMIKTCINAATHSLNIISALHEQNLLEMFMFLDLEMTFLSALSLVLVNIIIPGIAESSFVDVAKVVLQDMSSKGNIPAALLKSELDDICTLISSPSHPLRRSDQRPPLLRNTVAMVQDGQHLNDAILHVVELQHTPEDSNCDPDLGRARVSAIPLDTPRQQPETQKDLTTEQSPPWRSVLLPTNNSMSQPDEMNIDYANTVENPFTFNMADLQWLDSVQ